MNKVLVIDNGITALLDRARKRLANIDSEVQEWMIDFNRDPYPDYPDYEMIDKSIKIDKRPRDGKYGPKWGNK